MKPAHRLAMYAVLFMTISVPPVNAAAQRLESGSIVRTVDGLRPCPRQPAARPQAIDVPEQPPCIVVAVPVATLRPDPSGNRSDPGSNVSMDSKGRYYTDAARERATLIQWNADGSFAKSFGQAGGGPGEFDGRIIPRVFILPDDSLLILDHGAGRWSVFDSNLNFKRVFPATRNSRNADLNHVLNNGNLLSTGPVALDDQNFFHITDRSGALVRQFGAKAERTTLPPRAEGERVSAYGGASTFWTAPAHGEPIGLVLEEWNLTGSLVRTLTIRAPWMPANGYPHSTGKRREPELPEYDFMTSDAYGHIWIIAAVRDPRWNPTDTVMDRLYDGRMIVIDPVSSSVIATYVYDGPSQPQPPFTRIIPRTNRGYRIVKDDDGLASVEIFALHVVARQ